MRRDGTQSEMPPSLSAVVVWELRLKWQSFHGLRLSVRELVSRFVDIACLHMSVSSQMDAVLPLTDGATRAAESCPATRAQETRSMNCF